MISKTAIYEIVAHGGIDFDLDLNPIIVKINDTSHLPSDYIIKSDV